MYFRGIGPGASMIQAQWIQHVKKASQKYQKPSPLPRVESDPASGAVEALRTKLRAGKKLSPPEMDFLKEHAPELYQKAVRVARQREDYEKSLRQSQSRREADQKQKQQAAMMAEQLKRCDPEEAEMLVNAIRDAERKYRNSEEYERLREKEEK